MYTNGAGSDGLPISRERRAGGYGGFAGDSAIGPSYENDRSKEVELEPLGGNWRRRADRGDRDYSDRQRDRERRIVNGGGRRGIEGGFDLPFEALLTYHPDWVKFSEDVLESIRQDFPFMMDDNCIPVQVALQLMDSSSLGLAHQYDQFGDVHKQLEKALKAIVNEHHQGFNSSIGTFHNIKHSIQASITRVRSLKDSLAEAKVNLASTKPELKPLATVSQEYDEMLQILTQIENLQAIPEKLEARMTEKRFLTAVDTLQEGLRIIKRTELENIGALIDLKSYLTSQETSLSEILIEELHSHLYLKSPYCQDRWKPYNNDQSKNTGPIRPITITPDTKPIASFLEKLDVSAPMIEDASRNPEADSFYYIQLLVESLNKMGRLEHAVNSIEQRLPIEMDRVVDRTINEVDKRHPSTLRGKVRSDRGKTDLVIEKDDIRATIIRDLLSNLYSKFEAIAQGHRVLHDVVAGIVKREGLRNAGYLTGGFKELWKLYQNEMKKILHDYLSTDSNSGYRSGQIPAGGGNIFRSQRDKSRRIVKLEDHDSKSEDMAQDEAELDAILQFEVPGLVSNSRRVPSSSVHNVNQHQDGSATGHKLLIEPSVFNMGLLLPPSLTFLQSLKDTVPPQSDIVLSNLTSFLDDFLVNVFLPQLEETLDDLCRDIITDQDAFQQDPQWQHVARKPVSKGAVAFFDLILAFCKMLATIPHDQDFTQLIIGQMTTYYENACGNYKRSVLKTQSQGESGGRLKASAAFAESIELRDLLQKIWLAEGAQREKFLEDEANLLIQKTSDDLLSNTDIIADRKKVASLCLLYTSLTWLAVKINDLRHITTTSSEVTRKSDGTRQGKRWTLLTPSQNRLSTVYLPMTSETVTTFDGVLSSYRELSVLVLRTLNIEIRLHMIFALREAIQSTYLLPQPVTAPDPAILAMNADLTHFDEDMGSYLRETEKSFITSGLGYLVSTQFLALITSQPPVIVTLNANGCALLHLNVLVLQQNLKNIEAKASLSRASEFLTLFASGADAIVKRAQETGGKDLGFSYDEMNALIRLCFSERMASSEQNDAVQAKRQHDEKAFELTQYMWQS